MRRCGVSAVLALVLSLVSAVTMSASVAASSGSPTPISASALASLAPQAALPGASKFVAVTPTRVLDTRIGLGSTGSVPPGGTVTLVMPGHGGVPVSGVTAVLLNVTVAEATGPGFVQVFPTGQAAVGASSNLNIEYAGQTIPNLVVAPLGDVGQVSLFTIGGGHLIADVFGYFNAASVSVDGRYVPVFPNRLLDTRMQSPGKLAAGGSVRVQIAGRSGVPAAGASAVVLNVTATEATGAGYLQVLPTGQAAFGSFSNLNLVPGQTMPNLVVVPVGSDGSVTVFSERGTHVLVDVFGYFTNQTADLSSDGLFVPLSPTRLLDTRPDAKPGAGTVTSITPAGKAGLPSSGVEALFGTLTATEASGGGYIQVAPGPAATAPLGFWSNANIERAGQTIPNAAIANLGSDGTIVLYTSNATHLLFDAAGYFTGTAVIVNHPPTVLAIQVAVTGGQSIDVNVLDYASEPDGDPMTVTAFSQPGDGYVSQLGAGAIRYNSNAGADRNVTFTVTVSDDRGASTTATVTIHVAAGQVPTTCSIDFGGNGAYPAENAQITGAGGAAKRCVNSGFRGTGYIGNWNGNQAITFTVNAPASGQYNVSFRYQNATGTASRQLTVPNGTTTMAFANTHGGDTSGNWANGAWTEITVTVTLNAGPNSVTLNGGSGFVDLDQITTVTPTPGGLPAAATAVTIAALDWSNPDYGKVVDYQTAQGLFQVQWSDNANNETGYRIYEFTYPLNRTLLATVGANATSAVVTETGYSVNHITNNFEIVAFNGAGESIAQSPLIMAPTPNTPQINSYVQLNPSTVQINWTQAPALGFRASLFFLQPSAGNGVALSLGSSNRSVSYPYIVSYSANGVGVFNAVLTLTPSDYPCVNLAAWSADYGYTGSPSPPTCLSAPGTDPSTRTFEAEYATLTGSPPPVVTSANPGYNGTGYVGSFGSLGQRITFAVHDNSTYTSHWLYLRERSIESGITRRIYVNGVAAGSIDLPKTATAWTANAWVGSGTSNGFPVLINLHQGDNTIAIEYVGAGGNAFADIDSMTLTEFT